MSTNTQPRQPRGARVAGRAAGGEYSRRLNSPALPIYASSEEANFQRQAIVENLIRHGAVPATTVQSATNPRFTDGIDQWWAQHYERMEQPARGAAFDVMPDDYTPGMTSGNALSGHRRTHRIKYEGAGVVVRMPSATAIKRFAAEHGKRTFDVPVEMEHEGGRVSGYVRVTPGAGGTWEVQALNFPGKSAGRVAESVACVLEARRPSMALADAQRQYEARRALTMQSGELPSGGTLEGASALHQQLIDRMARQGAKMYAPSVKSAVVRSVGFDAATGTLAIDLNGRKYAYRSTREAYLEILQGLEPGRAYNDLVKGHANRVQAVGCTKCRRFTKSSVQHVCPPKQSRPRAKSAFRSVVATLFLGSLQERKAA